MNRELWERAQTLFHRSLDRPTEERKDYLEEQCGGDAELRREVLRMLTSDEDSDAFLEPPSPSGDTLAGSARLEGRELDDYELLEEIGRGGVGVVYRARQLSRDRIVAVKVLTPSPGTRPELLERFKREALAASRLRHDHIVPIIYYGEADGHHYYAMEYVDGPSLSQQLAALRALRPGEEPEQAPDLRDPQACARLALKVAEALEFCHASGIIHRDVKPQNILLGPDGEPRLADFGLAKNLELGDLTRSGEVAGTPHYMSPEQAQAQRRSIDHRTDVYSLGAVLYELLTGRPPSAGESTAEVIHNIIHEPIVGPRRLREDVPAPLAIICMKALRRSPEKRFQSARALARDLERYLEGRSIEARPPSLAERLHESLQGRRALTRLIPAALVLGLLVGVFFLQDPFQASRSDLLAATLELELAEGVAEAGVRLVGLDEQHVALGEPVELGRTSGGELSARVEPGAWRVVVRTADGATAEYFRVFQVAGTVSLMAHPRHTSEVAGELVRIAGGAYEHTHYPDGSREPVLRTIDMPTLWLDTRPVSIREYRAYLEATGQPPPKEQWATLYAQYWDSPPGDAWYDRPVTDISWSQALAYAEWAGKRLVTKLEYEYAALESGTEWFTPELQARAQELLVIGYPAPAKGVDTFALYERHVAPAASPEQARLVPHGLQHLFGNVEEWTESPGIMPGEPYDPLRWDTRMILSGSWYSPADSSLESLVRTWQFRPAGTASLATGFRCARTALE